MRAVDSLESQLGGRWDVVGMYTLLGNLDRAYAVAAVTGFGENTMNHVWAPPMQTFRQDPRFEALMDTMGLIDYWQQHAWPDLCRWADASLVCEGQGQILGHDLD